MQELFKIIVYLLQRMLQDHNPLFSKPKKIEITVSDGIRKKYITWTDSKGVKFDE